MESLTPTPIIIEAETGKVIISSEDHLRNLLRVAAAEGAKQALEDTGLGDFTQSDAVELINLLGMWRETKTTIWQTLVRTSTVAILLILVVGVAAHFKLLKVFGA